MKTLLAAAALSVAAGAASAATTYDLTAGDTGPFSFTCDVGGAFNGDGCDVTSTSLGIGINGKPEVFGTDQIDSIPGFETLIVTFSSAVRLIGFSLGQFSGTDDYDLSINGGAFAERLTANPFDGGGQIVTTFSIRASRTGGLFGGDVLNDKFTLASITIDPVEPIPLPATGWLLLAGAGGLAALRRRRAA